MSLIYFKLSIITEILEQKIEEGSALLPIDQSNAIRSFADGDSLEKYFLIMLKTIDETVEHHFYRIAFLAFFFLSPNIPSLIRGDNKLATFILSLLEVFL